MTERQLDTHGWDNDGELILTGSANAYIATTARPISGYYQGLRLCGRANFTNSGAATLEIFGQNSSTGLGAVPIRKGANAALTSGDIISGKYYDFIYDSANSVFQAMAAISSVSNAQLADMAQATIKGRASGAGTGAPTDLTGTQVAVILPDATTTQRGLVELATDAEIRSAATGNLAVTSASMESAYALVTLTDAATIAIDWDSFLSAFVFIAGNRTLGNPTNGQGGTSRTFYISGNDATLRSLAFDTFYHGALPALVDITVGKTYLITLFCVNTTFYVVTVKQAFP